MKDDFYCIIPCGGFGTRIKPFSKYIPKDLLPINGVPIICKVVEEIISIKKIKKIIFVTAPHKRIVTKVLNRYFPNDNYKFKFIIDNSYKGLDNSILLAKKYCRNAYGTLFYWPDCFNKENEVAKMISEYDGNSLIGITKVNDVRQYGSVVVKNLKILKIIQKPKFNKAKSGMVYWGKAIVNKTFWEKYKGDLDVSFMALNYFYLSSKPYDTGNLRDYALANYELTISHCNHV